MVISYGLQTIRFDASRTSSELPLGCCRSGSPSGLNGCEGFNVGHPLGVEVRVFVLCSPSWPLFDCSLGGCVEGP